MIFTRVEHKNNMLKVINFHKHLNNQFHIRLTLSIFDSNHSPYQIK